MERPPRPARPLASLGVGGVGGVINRFPDRESLNLEFVELEEKSRWASPRTRKALPRSMTRVLAGGEEPGPTPGPPDQHPHFNVIPQ